MMRVGSLPRWAVVGAAIVAGAGTVVAVAGWPGAASSTVPSVAAERTTFIDFLPVRGEVRPAKSIVLAAPSSGADLQIVELARNGATVAAGDIVVQFDSTAQQRTLEQKQSELKQAEAELERVSADGRRRVQTIEAALVRLRSAADRARLDLAKREIVSKVEGEKLGLAVADADEHVRAYGQKAAGERAATEAERTIARQKRDKASYDVADTERIIGSLTMRAPAAGSISLMPNFRAGGPFNRSPPEFKRGDRAWFGAAIAELPDLSDIRVTGRVDEADRARVQPGAAVRVRVDAVPDREMSGSIREISLVAKPDYSSWPPVRNFDLVIDLAEGDPRLRSGMSASARIELSRIPDVVVLPASAVFSKGGQSIVYVIDGRTPVARTIAVAGRSRDQVAVAKGVSPGERVALQDPAPGAAR